MENKKLKEFITTLQNMAMELDGEAKAEQAEQTNEQPAVQPQQIEQKEDVAAVTSATPYATSAGNQTGGLNCLKTYALPNNITVNADILKRTTKVTFDYFDGMKTFMGCKPMHVYDLKKENSFKLNISENVTDIVDVGHILNNSDYLDSSWQLCKKFDDYYIDGYWFTDHAPYYAERLKIYNEISPLTDTEKVFNGAYSWLSNGRIFKGYNYSGMLIFACDRNRNYARITYDTSSRIIKLQEGNEYLKKGNKVYEFTYDSSGNLIYITEERSGKRVRFYYNNKNLTKVRYPDGKFLSIDSTANSLTLTSEEDGYVHKLSTDTENVNITSQSTLSKVPGGTAKENSAMLSWKITTQNKTENNVTIKYVTIEDIEGNREYYKFNTSNGMLSEYCREENSVVTYAEKCKITFSGDYKNRYVTVYIAPREILNNTSYSQFSYNGSSDDETILYTYNESNNPTSETHKNIRLKDNSFMDVYDTRTYNSAGLVTNEKIEYNLFTKNNGKGTINVEATYTQFINCEYDSDSRLKKRTSYFTDRQSAEGTDVQEYVYTNSDDSYKITETSYNTKDSTAVFVNETIYDGYGNVTQTNSNGLKNITYSYNQVTDELQTIAYPEGCVINYGYADGKLLNLSSGNSIADKNEIVYTNGEVTKLRSLQNTFGFSFDGQRRLSEVTNDSTKLYDIQYSLENVNPQSVTIENAKGEKFICQEDKTDNSIEIKYGIGDSISTELKSYYSDQLLDSENDYISGETVSYTYDKAGNLTGYIATESDTVNYSATLDYRQDGSLWRMYQQGKTGINYEYFYDYGYNGKLVTIKADNVTVDINSDKLGRYTGRSVSYNYTEILSESIEYKKVSTNITTSSGTRTVSRQSNLPSKLTYNDNTYVSYGYYSNGNISAINNNGKYTSYTYDKLNRLTCEYNPLLEKRYSYTYDNNGNILSKKVEYVTDGTTTTYNYSYTNGRLTDDGKGHTISYDAIGNPTTWRGSSLTWTKGKRLTAFGSTTFEYDGRGRRIKKNSIVTNRRPRSPILKKGESYYYDYNDRLVASSNGMEYFYDHIGVAGFKYNGETYVYKRDMQNNVIAILDSNGNEVVKYEYNAWGEHTVTDTSGISLGSINPFRYRSYFYDTETKLYFLKTRYYDPEIGRFLSMDSIDYADPESINGLNLYAYCGNDPVNNVDPEGTIFFTCLIMGIVAGAVIGATLSGVNAYNNGARGWDVFGAAALGAVVGAAVGAVAGAFVGAGVALGGIGLSAIGSGAAALAGGGAIASGGALVAAGVGAVVAGGALSLTGVLGGLWELNVLMATIDFHGEPNSTVGNGNSEGIYDANGNLIYRKDISGRAHYDKGIGKYIPTPHTHGYIWKFIKGAWRIVKRFVF